MIILKQRIADLESRTDQIKADTKAVSHRQNQRSIETTHAVAVTAAQTTAADAKKTLEYYQYRYEGYDRPFMPSDKQINEALPKLKGRWRDVPLRGTVPTPGRTIPKFIWQTMKDIPSSWPPFYLTDMLKFNPKYKYFTMNDTDVDTFMDSVFAGTSVQWAFHKINPRMGAMKADIWRYAVLYIYGGVYLDTDSSFGADLDAWLKADDGYVVAPENNDYAECYRNYFPLHSSSEGFGNKEFLNGLPFDKRKLVQWLLISRARHPIMMEVK